MHALVVEEAVDIARELYAAVLDDPASQGSAAAVLHRAAAWTSRRCTPARPSRCTRWRSTSASGLEVGDAAELLGGTDLHSAAIPAVAAALVGLYRVYVGVDASLVEVNPLVVTAGDAVVALDAKITIDAGSVPRQRERLEALPGGMPPETGTTLELRARELGLTYIELDGDVGVLANGAGLTMTTLDAVHHMGGRPANFLEIGGDAYTKATPALELVLSDPKVKSLLVNFCGAFARTDVMAGGVVEAIEQLKPTLPIAFTIHGTGEDEAIALVRERLGVEPYDQMDDAVRAAVEAAAGVPA